MPARQLALGTALLGGSGLGICNLVHVDNLLRFIYQVLDSSDTAEGFYNVSDPEIVTWMRFYEAIAVGLGYPVSRIKVTNEGPRQVSPNAVLEWLKQRPLIYDLMKKVLNKMSAESKSRLKYYLPKLGGGKFCPPIPLDITVPRSSVHLNRELWTLHNTMNPLPTNKFVSDFGDPRLMSFDEGMAATLTWLRFAGYAAQV